MKGATSSLGRRRGRAILIAQQSLYHMTLCGKVAVTIRNILVPVAGAKSDRSTLETALLVARLFDGHLDALHVRVDPIRQLPIADETMIPTRLQELENVQK